MYKRQSLYCYNFLKDTLKKDDILYFDEAFDEAELSIIKGKVMEDFKVKSLGHSALAIAIQIVRPITVSRIES